jgi:hypothetical protein
MRGPKVRLSVAPSEAVTCREAGATSDVTRMVTQA